MALLALLIIVATLTGRRRSGQPSSRLEVSAPVFITTNFSGLQGGSVCISISNRSPGNLDFTLRWFDCRSKSVPNWAGNQTSLDPLRQTLLGETFLAPQSATNLTWTFATLFGNTFLVPATNLAGPNPPTDVLCCCEFEWQERPSTIRRAIGHWLDPTFKSLQNLFQPGWEPYSWSLDRLKPLASGFTFSSNVEVKEYFEKVCGLLAVGLNDRIGQRTAAQTNAARGDIFAVTNSQNSRVQEAFYEYSLTGQHDFSRKK